MDAFWEINEEEYLPDSICHVGTFTGASHAVAGIETHVPQAQYLYGLDDNHPIYSSIGYPNYPQEILGGSASTSTLQQSVQWHATTDATVIPRQSYIPEMNDIPSSFIYPPLDGAYYSSYQNFQTPIHHEVIPEVAASSFDSKNAPRDSPPVNPNPLFHNNFFDQATLDDSRWNNSPRKHPFVQSGRAYICTRGPCVNKPIFKRDKNSHDVAVHHDVPRDVSPEGSRSRGRRRRGRPADERSHGLEPDIKHSGDAFPT